MADKQFSPEEVAALKCPASLDRGLLTFDDGTSIDLESLVRQRDNLLEARDYAEEVQRIRTGRLGAAVENLHDHLGNSGALDGNTSAVQALIYRVRAEYALVSGEPGAAANEVSWRAKADAAEAEGLATVAVGTFHEGASTVVGEERSDTSETALAPEQFDAIAVMIARSRSGNGVVMEDRTGIGQGSALDSVSFPTPRG